MRKVFKILLPVLIVAVAFGAFRVLKSTKPEQEPPLVQERVWRVEVEPAEPRALAPALDLYGRVETPELLRATASAAAWVTEVAVRDGDRVAKDQVLVRLDERDFLPRIAQAEARIAELRAEIGSERNRYETDKRALEQEKRLLEIAGAAVDRQQRLKTQKVGAEQALDEAEQAQALQALAVSNREMSIGDHPGRLQALEARLRSAEAQRDELALEYERAVVRAPYEGIVTGVEVTEGDQVSKGAVLARMYALDELEVRARIPAPYQAELVGVLRADEPLEAEAAIGTETVGLELERLAGEAQPSGVDGLFRITGDPALLRLGQMLTLRLDRPVRVESIAVPFGAVYGGGRLYKVEDGRMRGVEVETLGAYRGKTGNERLLVRSPDIEAGDLIVTTHMPNAIEGLRVEAVGEHAVANAAAATPRPPAAPPAQTVQ
ncbi:MAG: biotin/lipoyl-binding protein [Thiohalocapsa sp.]|nr:biotin/lipoyl-binding protein [Thiohalocapsa sp.]MCF7989284.1 biotin/lipoyl-binding protein [Thiohalocapsa sp.]